MFLIYMSVPIITGIYPTLASNQGGTTMTIFGSNFTGATTVHFGITSATFTIDSDQKITTISPPGNNVVFVTVTNLEGTSPTTSNNQLTYIGEPILTTFNPTVGPTNGGTVVTISGSNFTGTSSVTFGGSPASVFTVDSDTIIHATTPSGTGTVNVNVTNVTGSTSLSGFDYIGPPIITLINPNQGPIAGGNSVTITGTGLGTTNTVFYGNNQAIFSVDSDTQLTVNSPGGTGETSVTVVTTVGTSNSLVYNYINLPVITNLNPSSGSTTGNNDITITGSDLSQTTSVDFGIQPVTPFYIISDTQLVVTIPPNVAGTVAVTATTPGGTSNSLFFTYINPPII